MGATCWPDVPKRDCQECRRRCAGWPRPTRTKLVGEFRVLVFFVFFTSMEFLKVECKDRAGPSRIDFPPGWAEVRSEPALIPSVFLSVSVRV